MAREEVSKINYAVNGPYRQLFMSILFLTYWLALFLIIRIYSPSSLFLFVLIFGIVPFLCVVLAGRKTKLAHILKMSGVLIIVILQFIVTYAVMFVI